MANLSTVDSVSSVQRVANAAVNQGPGINHGFAASKNVVDPMGRAIMNVPDKDSAEMYGNEG